MGRNSEVVRGDRTLNGKGGTCTHIRGIRYFLAYPFRPSDRTLRPLVATRISISATLPGLYYSPTPYTHAV